MLIHKAIEFATMAHKKQLRKGGDIPYIIHLFEVALILAKNGASDEVICARILHDTLEDTNTTKQDLIEHFGEKIASLVCANSENKTLSWEERKQETIDYITTEATEEELLVICADKLSNIKSIKYDYDKLGDKLWSRFKRGYIEQKWYYLGLSKALSRLENHDIYKEFKAICRKVFKE
jgi:(p)ppGpp synthase/HD superfamily hydrolase